MTVTSGAILVALSEETVSRLMSMRRCSSERMDDTIARLLAQGVAEPTSMETNKCEPSDVRQRYVVHILGERYRVRTLVEALARVLNTLADLDPAILDRLQATGGRSRRNVARSRDAIHQGRADLNGKYTLEFRPGWWTGTNYSRRDICRIMRDACLLCGLTYGRDMALVDC